MLKMINLIFKMMAIAFKMMDFGLKMMDFGFKMMILIQTARYTRRPRRQQPLRLQWRKRLRVYQTRRKTVS